MKQPIIIKYVVVAAHQDDMNTQATRLIERGYQPYGAPSVGNYERAAKIVQAFVKYKP